MTKRYWLSVGDGQTYGPYTVDELRAFSAQGRVGAAAMVCEEGAQQWGPANPVIFGDGRDATMPPPPPPPPPIPVASAGSQPTLPLTPPTTPPPPDFQGSAVLVPGGQDASAKSKLAAGLFGILLGWLGVHNFYLGHTGKALAQLLITLLTCGYLGIISWIWGLVEGIMILAGTIQTDARGVRLRD